jgi:heme/copper-type cytochrome/quinol oxidase subunit 2
MGCIPFFLCTKKFNAKLYDIIALGCNVLKLSISIASIFLIAFSILAIAFFSSFFEFAFTITNLVHMAVILCKLNNGEAYDKSNKCCRILCIVSMVFSGIIIFLRVLTLIIGIVFYNQADKWLKEKGISGGAPAGEWAKLLIPLFLYIIVEIIHFLSVNYLYKLLKLKTDVNYEEYLKGGQTVEQNSMTNVQITQNQPVLSTNLPNQTGYTSSNNKV